MASNAQKLSAAAQFIKDAPPGEMQRVLDGTESRLNMPQSNANSPDLHTILEKDSDSEFRPSLEQYNTEQLITFKTRETDRRVSLLN